MAGTDELFAGSIPEIYDRYLVPLIFEPYALDLAKRVQKLDPRHVLETAAGTGVLTRAMAARLSNHARIFATDLNQPMLDRARTRQTDDARIDWRQADALNLPFEDRHFDIVTCQFGAMFFPDKVRGYGEARRVLKPGGQFMFNVWDKISENEFPDVVTEALTEFFPSDPPRFLARTPHGYHDPNRIREELAAAGFANVAVEAVDAVSKASSALDAAIAFCQGTPLRNEIEARDASRLKDATKHAADALERRFGSGPIEGSIRALVITAVA
jgi:ubiquinone/menaquinone biosynthesis C-methylase UbiE